eukprot:TRINITY_DN7916_c0_g1_i3.p1 TRINITY_DN7916_c0_g1~~TRINITY_DN7916_c0_g1_i3.p1  ORF type:complete len:110 (+),score=19.10 TRINITY_DN7916_c0_g1_i3:240-569(+)
MPVIYCQNCGLERPIATAQCPHARVELATWPRGRSSEETSSLCIDCGSIGLELALHQQQQLGNDGSGGVEECADCHGNPSDDICYSCGAVSQTVASLIPELEIDEDCIG